jgi:hypothetical protein
MLEECSDFSVNSGLGQKSKYEHLDAQPSYRFYFATSLKRLEDIQKASIDFGFVRVTAFNAVDEIDGMVNRRLWRFDFHGSCRSTTESWRWWKKDRWVWGRGCMMSICLTRRETQSLGAGWTMENLPAGGCDQDQVLFVLSSAFDFVPGGKEAVETFDEKWMSAKEFCYPCNNHGCINAIKFYSEKWERSVRDIDTYSCDLNSFMVSKKRE